MTNDNSLLPVIDEYWTKRAPGYSEVNQEELAGNQKYNWLRVLQKGIETTYPKHNPKDIKILDIGTGPGFFAIILAEAGYDMTAVDYTEAMLEQAKLNAGKFAKKIHFLQMDGQNLDFPEETFHVVLSRNLTWVLEEPDKAYASWRQVLKKGGLLLNFDANWYNYLFDEEKKREYENDRNKVQQLGIDDHYTCTDIDAMEEIARKVPLSRKCRPQWDIEVLEKLNMALVTVDMNVWEQVWSRIEKVNYASTPMFMITAMK